MTRAILIYLLYNLIAAFKDSIQIDFVYQVDYLSLHGIYDGDCIFETLSPKEACTGKAALVSTPERSEDFESHPTPAHLPFAEKSSLSRSWTPSSCNCSHEECSEPTVAMHPMQAIAQVERNALHDMPNAVASCDGPELHPWRQAEFPSCPSTTTATCFWRCVGELSVGHMAQQAATEFQRKKIAPEQRQGKRRFWTRWTKPTIPFLSLSCAIFTSLSTISIYGSLIDVIRPTSSLDGTPHGTCTNDDAQQRYALDNGWTRHFCGALHCHDPCAARYTGSSCAGFADLPAISTTRPTTRCSTEGPALHQESRCESNERPPRSRKTSGCCSVRVRGGIDSALPTHWYMEAILGRGGQELVRIWFHVRAARADTAEPHYHCQGAVPGRQSVPRGVQKDGRETQRPRDQRRRRASHRIFHVGPADYSQYPILVDVFETVIQGGRSNSRGRAYSEKAENQGARGQDGRDDGRQTSVFSLGRLSTTITCSSPRPQALDAPAILALKWSHTIVQDPTFLCEKGAREKAIQLSMELRTFSPATTSSWTLRSTSRKSSRLHVGFATELELRTGPGSMEVERFPTPNQFLCLRHYTLEWKLFRTFAAYAATKFIRALLSQWPPK